MKLALKSISAHYSCHQAQKFLRRQVMFKNVKNDDVQLFDMSVFSYCCCKHFPSLLSLRKYSDVTFKRTLSMKDFYFACSSYSGIFRPGW